MPRLIDRRSGDTLGRFTATECAQLNALLDRVPDTDEPFLVDPQLVERYAELGASERLLTVLQQVLQGREDLVLDWAPDGD